MSQYNNSTLQDLVNQSRKEDSVATIESQKLFIKSAMENGVIPHIGRLPNSPNIQILEYLIEECYIHPNHLLRLIVRSPENNDQLLEWLICEKKASIETLKHDTDYSLYILPVHLPYLENIGYTEISGRIQQSPVIDTNLLSRLLENVPDDKKKVELGGITFDLSALDLAEPHGNHLMSHASIYRDCIRLLSEFKKDLPDEQKDKIISAYQEYASINGFFFRAIVINFFYTSCEDGYMLSWAQKNKILPNNLNQPEFKKLLSFASQLSTYDLTKYSTLVIACSHGLDDKSLIDHQHFCQQAHTEESLSLDRDGFAHNADIIGFDFLNIDHWRIIANQIGSYRFNKIEEHTADFFMPSYIPAEDEAEMELVLKEVASFARDNILVQGGEIDCLGEDGTINPISSHYFQ